MLLQQPSFGASLLPQIPQIINGLESLSVRHTKPPQNMYISTILVVLRVLVYKILSVFRSRAVTQRRIEPKSSIETSQVYFMTIIRSSITSTLFVYSPETSHIFNAASTPTLATLFPPSTQATPFTPSLWAFAALIRLPGLARLQTNT